MKCSLFTGIVEEVGEVISAFPNKLCIKCQRVLKGTSIGDSISVNGVCLTVVDICDSSFSVDVMPETLNRSSIGALKTRDKVNLERAMPINGRFGGHILTGHIDGVGRILDKNPCGNAVVFSVLAPYDIMKYIITKGSVSLDGISLTVVSVGSDKFSVSIIPHTIDNTCLKDKKTGDILNIECDIIGKYIEKFINKSSPKITYDFLKENGFA